MFLVEHVPGLSQGDNHDTKIAPLQTYGLKLINCPEGTSLLKDQRPSWTHISSWNDGRFTDLSDQHSLSQTGVNGGLSHGSVRQRHVKGGHGLKGMSPTAPAKDVPADCIPQRMERENFFHHSYATPSLGSFITCHLLDLHKAN